MYIFLLFSVSCLKFKEIKFINKGKDALIKSILENKELIEIKKILNESKTFNGFCDEEFLNLLFDSGREDVIQLLLDEGASLRNLKNLKKSSLIKFIQKTKQSSKMSSRSLLHFLISNQYVEETLILLDKLKEIEEKNRESFLNIGKRGREAIYNAVDLSQKEIVERIISLYSKKLLSNFKSSKINLIDRAILNNDIEMLFLLIDLSKKYPELSNYEMNLLENLIKVFKEDSKKRIFEEDGPLSKFLNKSLKNKEKQKVKKLEQFLKRFQGKQISEAFLSGSILGDEKIVLILIDLVSKEDINEALNLGSKYKRTKIIEILLTKGAEINKGDWTALYLASSWGHKEVVELLIDGGAEINKGDFTALSGASQNGHKEVVELLLSKGAKIDTGDWTALYVASANGHKEVVELLLSKGAKINKGNWTPLYVAGAKEHKEVVELLLEKGADIYKASNSGLKPFMVADLLNRQDIILMFVNKLKVVPSDEVIYGKDVKPIIENILPKEIELFRNEVKHPIIHLTKNMDLWFSLIVSMAEKIQDSSLCINSGLLSYEDSLDRYKVIANLLPFSYIEENFHKIEKLNGYEYNGLHFAVLKNSPDDLKKLLTSSIFKRFVNGFNNDENKESPLLLAKRLSKEEHMKILLSFGANPYIGKWNSIFDAVNINEYIKNQILLNVLRDGRIEDACKLIFTASYKDIIDLRVKDECGRNVFHYLAEYAFDEMEIEHILNHLSEKVDDRFAFKSFKIELFFECDKEGHAPFYLALINSNEYFIRYFLSNEELRERATKSTERLKSIEYIVSKNRVTKEILDILKRYIWKKDNKEKLSEILLEILKEDNSEELEKMFKSKKAELGLSESFLEEIREKSIAFGAINCWELAISEKINFQKEREEEILIT